MSLFIETVAQSKMVINEACSYYGENTTSSVYTFKADVDALAALKLITEASGLASNFKMMAANIPNAAAVVFNGERYILYNQTFMYNISQRINYWASISILAHELGHHLNGHSLKSGGSRPSIEIEADKFSGFILSKMGSTLEDAQSAINLLVSEEGSYTHPGRSARLAAIANGWYSAGGRSNKINDNNITYSTNVGSILPNFSQNDPYGNQISLNDFRGKYVLVHFWASWSTPDIEEMNYLVLANNRFKSKNFTLLGVSLDNDRWAWFNAIEKNNLSWSHVSDLKYWNNEVARKFNIVSIPSNFLLDRNGKIIAKNLRGNDLLQTLNTLLY
jgi:peroxiredoxin